MKISKSFSLEIEDLNKFEAWIKTNNINGDSRAFRLLLKKAGVILEI